LAFRFSFFLAALDFAAALTASTAAARTDSNVSGPPMPAQAASH
jgi:hypothetical protein